MPQTILVVDDQSSVRQLVQDYLTEQGFRVVTATDGQNAIYAARHEKPDLILLDIMMPRMDGYQFLRQFREEAQTPVIIITAREEETDAVLGLDLGADDYVVKPFRMRELTARDPGSPAPHGGYPPAQRGVERGRHRAGSPHPRGDRSRNRGHTYSYRI